MKNASRMMLDSAFKSKGFRHLSTGMNIRSKSSIDKAAYDEAMSALNEALRIDPKLAYAHFEKGLLRAKVGDHEGAIKDFEAMMNVNKTGTAALIAHFHIGEAKGNLNCYNDAEQEFTKVISLDSKCIFAYIKRGYARLKLNRHQDAFDDFTKAIKLAGKNPDEELCASYSGLCIACKHLGMEQKASEYYGQAKSVLHCRSAFQYFMRGEAHKLFGDKDAALKDYNDALNKDPNCVPAKAAMEELTKSSSQQGNNTSNNPTEIPLGSAESFLNMMREIRASYQSVDNPNVQEILNKFIQLLDEYPDAEAETRLSRAEFNLHMYDRVANAAQKQFTLESAQKDYESVRKTNPYSQVAAAGLEKIARLLPPASSSAPSYSPIYN
ncbi:MAG: tetratricopeptide repeat protein [Proteobacteria bacterium]|nr:tetratricopeptide repeat protein [Pseudomonadota bacterium]